MFKHSKNNINFVHKHLTKLIAVKKNLIIIFGLIFIFSNCTFDECTSKSLYMTSFENFIDKTKDKYDNYKDEDWKKADSKFEKLTEECFKKFEDEFSEADKRKIVKYSLKYGFYRVKSELPIKINTDSKEWNEFFDNINSIVDKEEDITKLFEKIKKDKNFNKAIKDFGKGLKNLEKGLNKFSKEIEEIFDEINKESK